MKKKWLCKRYALGKYAKTTWPSSEHRLRFLFEYMMCLICLMKRISIRFIYMIDEGGEQLESWNIVHKQETLLNIREVHMSSSNVSTHIKQGPKPSAPKESSNTTIQRSLLIPPKPYGPFGLPHLYETLLYLSIIMSSTSLQVSNQLSPCYPGINTLLLNVQYSSK